MRWSLLLLLVSCESPSSALNLVSPDRLGYGLMDQSMTLAGTGQISTWWDSQIGDLDFDLEGEGHTTMIWLEWDLPEWKEHPSNYERYLRDRLRVLQTALDNAQ